jgi:hypothetical protein
MADEKPDIQQVSAGDAPTNPDSTNVSSDGTVREPASDDAGFSKRVRTSDVQACGYFKKSIHDPTGVVKVSQKMANNKFFSLPPGSYAIVDEMKWEEGLSFSDLREIIEVETKLASGELSPFDNGSSSAPRKDETLPDNYESTLTSVRIADRNIPEHLVKFIESNMASRSKEEVLRFKQLKLYG